MPKKKKPDRVPKHRRIAMQQYIKSKRPMWRDFRPGMSFGYRFRDELTANLSKNPGPGSYNLTARVRTVLPKRKKAAKRSKHFGGAPRFVLSHRERTTPGPIYHPKPRKKGGAARIVSARGVSKLGPAPPGPGPADYEVEIKKNVWNAKLSKAKRRSQSTF
jgi:hypothetical protein